MRYFVAGNIWLFLALAIFMLGKTERTGPTFVSFLGIGTWFRPGGYNLVALLVFLIACAFFVVGRRRERKNITVRRSTPLTVEHDGISVA